MTQQPVTASKKDPDTYPKAVAAQYSCTGDTWVLVPDGENGTVAVVDDVAYRVWALCDGTRTSEQITDLVSRTIGNPISGTTEFVEQLHRVGLVTVLEYPTMQIALGSPGET
ncbi:PqqD family protein [Nocardia sp. NBC_01388]|uniref:PqqD family protein n=1 Tax=Nocardia sp. NBC_01388 TaxID=2903596 RepID=UPI00324B6DB0